MRTGNLVLSRQPTETIRIGGDISVTVVQIRGKKVSLAIEAPRDVSVHREEIWKRIQEGTTHES